VGPFVLGAPIRLAANPVAKKAQSKSLEGAQGTSPYAADWPCCGGARPSLLSATPVLGPASQTGGALVLRRRVRRNEACFTTHSLPRDRPPKGKGGPRLGSLDKGWCRHEWVLNDSESCWARNCDFSRITGRTAGPAIAYSRVRHKDPFGSVEQ